ncbi:Sporozoite surface protein 2 [Senna tora]|uniref:Sporozoite surface protein 2 n=1 Tax=Senna tora TaxID=362788 RepID=A0A834SHX8_9FABA|nr:Sporozoite surface protein 2 [Senna tora]
MLEMRGVDENACKHLLAISPRFWSKSRFSTTQHCDALLKSETFNSVIVDFREKPILTMLEAIRGYLMNRWDNCRRNITTHQEKESYEECYGHIIYPTNGSTLWPSTQFPDVLPPNYHRGPGRPKKRTRKATYEKEDQAKKKKVAATSDGKRKKKKVAATTPRVRSFTVRTAPSQGTATTQGTVTAQGTTPPNTRPKAKLRKRTKPSPPWK